MQTQWTVQARHRIERRDRHSFPVHRVRSWLIPDTRPAVTAWSLDLQWM